MSIKYFIPLLGPQFEQFWPLQGDNTLKQLVISASFLVVLVLQLRQNVLLESVYFMEND